MKYKTDDLRIQGLLEVSTPEEIHSELPLSDAGSNTVHQARDAIHKVLHAKDDRLVVVVGPCSIHDPEAALEYARRLQPLREELKGELEVVMRVYFEKPRTTVGWKGLINDPDLDDSFQINKGLRVARQLLGDINDMGIPAGTEYLDLISPQYVSDLISWGAIGARTTESQCHRELSSGLSCPVGFKNATNGGIKVATDAIQSASRPHHFLSVTKEGRSAIFKTSGNEDCHVILRGGGGKTNFDAASVQACSEDMESAGLLPRIMIDFSHANSSKQHDKQKDVATDVAAQIAAGDDRIFGVMIESHLVEGRQDAKPGQTDLTYGQSITDACINWDDTDTVLRQLADAVAKRRG